jgi:hypothetical protein
MLRAGDLNLNRSVSVLKDYIRFLNETFNTFDDEFPLTWDDTICHELIETVMPYR